MKACVQVFAARREMVRELLHARRSDLPLTLDLRASGSGVSLGWLRLAPNQGALIVVPRERGGSLMAPTRGGALAEYPRMGVDALVLLPGDVQQAASIRGCEASEASAEVRQIPQFRILR